MDTRNKRRRVGPTAPLAAASRPDCAANCGMDDEYKQSSMYPCCGSGNHFVHVECLNRLFQTNDDPRCPTCRCDFLSVVKDLCIQYPQVQSDDESDDEYAPSSATAPHEEAAFPGEIEALRHLVAAFAVYFVRRDGFQELFTRNSQQHPPSPAP